MNHPQASLCDPCPPRYYCVNKDRADPCPTGKYCIGKALISDLVLMGINFANVLKIFLQKNMYMYFKERLNYEIISANYMYLCCFRKHWL